MDLEARKYCVAYSPAKDVMLRHPLEEHTLVHFNADNKRSVGA